jgi:hypothetical protein
LYITLSIIFPTQLISDIHKMKAYGITGNLINWFNSYLKSRRQKVVSLQESHKAQSCPLLFIIYISVNDIADKLVSLSRLFADDRCTVECLGRKPD